MTKGSVVVAPCLCLCPCWSWLMDVEWLRTSQSSDIVEQEEPWNLIWQVVEQEDVLEHSLAGRATHARRDYHGLR